MRRLAVLASALILGTATSLHAQAQSRAAAARPDSLVQRFAGTWEGSMTSPHGNHDGLRLVISRDSAWHAEMIMPPGTPIPAGVISDVAVTGNDITWVQTIQGMRCQGRATNIGGTLRGEADCGHAGIGFMLSRHEGH